MPSDWPCTVKSALAKRDDEKRIALDILKQVISAESLALAVENLDKPTLQEAAARVAVTISQKLVASQPAAVAKAMEKVLQVTKNKDLTAKATVALGTLAEEIEVISRLRAPVAGNCSGKAFRAEGPSSSPIEGRSPGT